MTCTDGARILIDPDGESELLAQPIDITNPTTVTAANIAAIREEISPLDDGDAIDADGIDIEQ